MYSHHPKETALTFQFLYVHARRRESKRKSEKDVMFLHKTVMSEKNIFSTTAKSQTGELTWDLKRKTRKRDLENTLEPQDPVSDLPGRGRGMWATD